MEDLWIDGKDTYPWPIWTGVTVLIIVSHFVKVVLVELAHKAGKVAVLEVFGEDVFGEFLILYL